MGLNKTKTRNSIAFVIAVFFTVSNFLSQNNDSLYKVFNSVNKHDTIRVEALVKVVQDLIFSIPDSARKIAIRAVEFSKQKKLVLWENRALKAIGVSYFAVGDYKKAITYIEQSAQKLINSPFESDLLYTYSILGVLYRDISKYDQAIEYHNKSLAIAKKLKDEDGMENNYNNLGIVYKSKGEFPKALNCYFDALKLCDKSKDSDSHQKCLNNIGIVYQIIGNYSSAMKYFSQSLELNNKSKEKRQRGSTLLNIGNNFLLEKKYNEAKNIFYESLDYAIQTNDTYIISAVHNSVGEIFTEENQLDSALYHYTLSEKLLHDSGNREDEAISLNAMSKIYLKKGNHGKSIELSLKALQITQKIGALEGESKSHLQLYDSYKISGNYKDALNHFIRYKEIVDTMTKRENIEEITKRQLNYEFDKKTVSDSLKNAAENKIRELSYTQNLHQQKIYAAVGITGFLIAIIISLIIYRGYRMKKKTNLLLEEKNTVITLAKNEVEHQKHIIEEKQKEIVDSINYARRIQYTLLANAKMLEENLKEHFVFFQPKDIVSGDFYWATKKDNLFYIAVCDSTGHGVPGAFMSLLNIGFLSEAINEKDITDPGKIFDYVRKRLTESISKEGQKDGFDGILLCFDKKNNKISYAAANNEPITIYKNNIIELDKNKMPVGIGEYNTDFNTFTLEKNNCDMLYLYTDGYADQFGGEKGKKFKYKTLNELLSGIHSLTMQEQKIKLKDKFNEWKGNLEQVDDVLVIGIKV